MICFVRVVRHGARRRGVLRAGRYPGHHGVAGGGILAVGHPDDAADGPLPRGHTHGTPATLRHPRREARRPEGTMSINMKKKNRHRNPTYRSLALSLSSPFCGMPCFCMTWHGMGRQDSGNFRATQVVGDRSVLFEEVRNGSFACGFVFSSSRFHV